MPSLQIFKTWLVISLICAVMAWLNLSGKKCCVSMPMSVQGRPWWVAGKISCDLVDLCKEENILRTIPGKRAIRLSHKTKQF